MALFPARNSSSALPRRLLSGVLFKRSPSTRFFPFQKFSFQVVEFCFKEPPLHVYSFPVSAFFACPPPGSPGFVDFSFVQAGPNERVQGPRGSRWVSSLSLGAKAFPQRSQVVF